MVKVRKAGVETPCLYLVDSANTKIYMEKIDGVTAKHFFQTERASSSSGEFFFRANVIVYKAPKRL